MPKQFNSQKKGSAAWILRQADRQAAAHEALALIGISAIKVHKPSSLELLRRSAQEILFLTQDCKTMPQAAQELYLKVQSAPCDDQSHNAMRTSLEIVALNMASTMAEFIEQYALVCANEESNDANNFN